jgi:hypothetical protein
LQRAGIHPQRRAESLSLDEWRWLVQSALGIDQGN